MCQDCNASVMIRELLALDPASSQSVNNDDNLRKFVVRNVATWAPSKRPDYNGPHIWTLMVTGPASNSRIDDVVEKVVFYLPVSYRPSVIEVKKSPFEITQRSWGQFSVICRLFFVDPRNRPIDISHIIELDKCFSGRPEVSNDTVVTLSLRKVGNPQETYWVGRERNEAQRHSLPPQQQDLTPYVDTNEFVRRVFRIIDDFVNENDKVEDVSHQTVITCSEERRKAESYKEYCPALLDHYYAKRTPR